MFPYAGSVSGGGVGLAIANALMLTGMFQWGVRQSAEIESQAEMIGSQSVMPHEQHQLSHDYCHNKHV
ncbi:hypothetical protein MRX96_039615 [Rhipicephalus microplus]